MIASTKMNITIVLALVIIACNNQCITGLKILAISPLNSKSHFVLCERLAKGLADKGHQIDVYSHFPQKKSVPNYTDFSLAGTFHASMNNVTYESIRQFKTMDVSQMLNMAGSKICEIMGTPVFQKLFERLRKGQQYDIVIVEAFFFNCYLAWGPYLNVPMIGIMTCSVMDWYNDPLGNPINTAVTPSIWGGFAHPMSFVERLKNTFMFHSISLLFSYHIKDQDKYVEQFFGTGYPSGSDLVKNLDLLLVNTHHTLEGVRAYTPAVVPVAGLHINDDDSKLPNEVQKWLDDSKHGCIYISFGSMVRIETFPKDTLKDLYAAFKNIAPVRVLMKIAKPDELPPGLPANVMTQTWFSQLQVLKHKNVRAFVSHGGTMSLQESLYAGVPVVGVPLFGDQKININLLVRKNIAKLLEADDITENGFTAVTQEILSNPIYKKNAEQFSKVFLDRPMSPIDTATFWIEYISRHGKDALRSPIVDMPWWQSNLIDVYGSILIVFILACYLLKRIFCKALNLTCSMMTHRNNDLSKKER